MKKQMDYFRSNRFILVMMALVFCFVVVSVRAEEKQDAKVNGKNDSKANSPSSANKSQNTLCKKVALLIKNGTINEYVPPVANIPDISVYQNLDIDEDGIPDKVEVSSGSEGSYLEVVLSSGSKYELDDGSIMIVKLKGKAYALVTYFDWKILTDGTKVGKEVGHRLHLLTKNGVKMVCDNF
jgi:hypothetical protein